MSELQLTHQATSTDETTHSFPTSLAVARRAGVSQSAVSLVFGGKAAGRLSKQTQAAILRAAEELGYHPHHVARTLRSGRSRVVVFAVPDVSNPYFASVLQGVEQAARAHQYATMLVSVQDEPNWQHIILDALASQAVDGCLLYAPFPETFHKYSFLQGRAVLIDAFRQELPSLQLDVSAGVHAAIHHLLQHGHTRIAHLAATVQLETFHLRHRAYQNALEQAGISVPVCYHERTPFLLEEAFAAARRLLTCSEPPSAILCDSDVLAVGVYKAARALHRSIPTDLSVIGFDNSMIATILEPELTTVAVPAMDIGKQAFLQLISLIEGDAALSHITVPLELVVRTSTSSYQKETPQCDTF